MTINLETSGFVFDLDGTLTKTQNEFHAKAECAVLAKYGVHLKPENISKKFAGIPTKKVFEELAPGIDTETLTREKWIEMYRMINTNDLHEVEGMPELVRFLESKGCPISIASASPLRWIRLCMERRTTPTGRRLGSSFKKRFVSAEHCDRPKPYPDVFLKGKEVAQNSTHRERTFQWFAVGDGESDVEAGLAADMHVLYLSENNTKYDTHERVKRFSTSAELISFILNSNQSN